MRWISDALMPDPLVTDCYVVYDGHRIPVVLRQDLTAEFARNWMGPGPIHVRDVAGFADNRDEVVSRMLAVAAEASRPAPILRLPEVLSTVSRYHMIIDAPLEAFVASPMTSAVLREMVGVRDMPIFESPDVDEGVVLSLPGSEYLGMIPYSDGRPRSAVLHAPENVARWRLHGIRFGPRQSGVTKGFLLGTFRARHVMEAVLDS